jgi:pimeloyl-ACP methyl ester carboxylesterase
MILFSSRRCTLAGLALGVLCGAILGCGGGSDSATPAAATVPTTSAAIPDSASAVSYLHWTDPNHALVDAAGYVAKTATVNGVHFSYVEGPDNGPPLVLLHAQLLDWFSYSNVLPALSKSFHVYDIDYQGHGATTVPAGYAMTANQIGADLGDLIAQKIGKPVYITGNSSGGLLTAWLAANRPELIKAAALEDPPLFSSEYPAIKTTIAYPTFATSYTAVNTDHPVDFLLYWVSKSTTFFDNNIGAGSAAALTVAIKAYRLANPGQPVEMGMIEDDSIRMLLRGLDYQYDPRFGAAFYDGTWNAGFDHATALAKIACPVLLMQANTTTEADGTLNGAMTLDQAQQAMALLKNGTYLKVDSGHVINLEQPDQFVTAIKRFFLNQ